MENYTNKKFNQPSYYSVNTNHPIQQNAQEYIIYHKFISIHSEDRDMNKYPKSNTFEIELPEDYLNVNRMALYSWTFPSNYNAFSITNNNITMTFQINKPYNPNINGVTDALQLAIYQALFDNINNNYKITIEEGFYNPTQMTTELTNKFNQSVTEFILNYFSQKGYTSEITDFINSGGYQEFIIVYNNVGQNIWFGNSSSGFILTNSTSAVISKEIGSHESCNVNVGRVPDYSNWGLPSNLGLKRCDVSSTETSNVNIPRFYYGDVFPGDAGFWLTPNPTLPGAQIYFIHADYKINLMGQAEFYMELSGYNCIDETTPYNLSKFTVQTNQTNSIVNSAFAKIPVSCTPISQYYGNNYDLNNTPHKLFYPPAERIRKLSVKLRYHDGAAVDFGVFNYSFVLLFELLIPQINRSIKNVGIGN